MVISPTIKRPLVLMPHHVDLLFRLNAGIRSFIGPSEVSALRLHACNLLCFDDSNRRAILDWLWSDRHVRLENVGRQLNEFSPVYKMSNIGIYTSGETTNVKNPNGANVAKFT